MSRGDLVRATRAASLVALVLCVALPARAEEVRCRDYSSGKKVAFVDTKRVREASGLVVSELQPGLFWTHNDSGAEPYIYALDEDGAELARVELDGVDAVDWEDMALGRCGASSDERACLYLSDTGNNGLDRDDQAVHRLVEPMVEDGDRLIVAADTMWVTFDEPEDVEALFLDGQGALWFAGKDTKRTRLYRVDGFRPDGDERAELVADRGDVEFVTGASSSADGTHILLRSDSHVWELFRPKGRAMRSAFLGELLEVDLRREQQGEAVAFAPDGSGFYTTSEGKDAPIRWYHCQETGPTLSGKSDSGGIVADPVADSGGCAGGDPMSWAWIFAVLVVPLRRRR